jgi:hypothetical protein
MRVQLVYFEGCPNVEAARQNLHDVLAKHRLTVPIEMVCASAADAPLELRGWGSPTILVNGGDVGGEPAPCGSSCRLYRGPDGRIQRYPPPPLIEAALVRARNRGAEWVRSLAALPGALLPLLPSVSCPACVAAYAGVLSSLGLGFVLSERVLAPVILALLAVGVAGVAWSTRSHRHAGPLAATLLGSIAVIAGRLVWRVPPVLYVGIALLVAASLWNLWLKRPRRSPLIQLNA